MAQGSATNREISSCDCRPLSSPRHTTTWHIITMIMAERATGPSGSVEEHTGKPSLGGARQRHEGNLEPSTPGATENLTQSPSYPEGHGAPTNGLLIPVSVTQCNMSCFQQGCLTASVSLSDGVYKECRCNAQDTCSIVWKVR